MVRSRVAEQVRDVDLETGQEVVDAQEVIARLDQTIAEVAADETGAAGGQDSFHGSMSRKVRKVKEETAGSQLRVSLCPTANPRPHLQSTCSGRSCR